MNDHRWFQFKWLLSLAIVTTMVMGFTIASGADLKEVKERGVLRHLGIPYANFITGSGDHETFCCTPGPSI
jgi:hypothetical protein